MRALQMALTKTAISALALFITGCATLSPSIPPGASKADVEMVLGKPVDVVTAPGGEVVWQYPRGPVGQTTYMVAFGVDGRAKGIRQALTWENLAGIRPGMTRDEVRLALGRPGGTVTYRNLGEEVWSYRYQIPVSSNLIFNVHFDAATGKVRSTSEQIDPLFTVPFRVVG
jgi:outer membrane protein assembly factor BamE (lipoprotein component of BamABCDE complex)